MRYELQSKSVGTKINVFDVENIAEEKNKAGEVIKPATTKETPTNKHAYSVGLSLVDTDSRNKTPFTEHIMVEVTDTMTVKEVDAEIEKQVNAFVKNINS